VLVLIESTYFSKLAEYDFRKVFALQLIVVKDVDSDTGLDHCSKNGTKTFTSNDFFEDRIKDLQNTLLYSLVFLLSINVGFTMKLFFAESALLSKWRQLKSENI